MSDPSLYEWIALRRVHDGGVGKVAGVYLDHGRPTPDYLAEVFDRLIWTGWASVAEGDPLWALRRLCLTEAGATRYAELCERERVFQQHQEVPPEPEFDLQAPDGRQLSDARPSAPDDDL
ncbi:MAG: hypothetical protein ACRDTG_20445 [Pseudonocardiaceae bacterium]